MNIVSHSIQDIEDNIRTLRRQQYILRANRAVLNHRLTPLLKAKDAGWLPWTPSIYTSSAGYGSHEIYAHMSGVDGFKHEALAAILEAYIDADEVTTTDAAAQMTRVYKFTFNANSETERPEIKVMLEVRVKSDSATCQRVLKEVKETVQKTEVYELVCNEGA